MSATVCSSETDAATVTDAETVSAFSLPSFARYTGEATVDANDAVDVYLSPTSREALLVCRGDSSWVRLSECTDEILGAAIKEAMFARSEDGGRFGWARWSRELDRWIVIAAHGWASLIVHRVDSMWHLAVKARNTPVPAKIMRQLPADLSLGQAVLEQAYAWMAERKADPSKIEAIDIDDTPQAGEGCAVEVTITYEDGCRRACSFLTPSALLSSGDVVEGTTVRMQLGVPHMIFASELSREVIEKVVYDLAQKGQLDAHTRPILDEPADAEPQAQQPSAKDTPGSKKPKKRTP